MSGNQKLGKTGEETALRYLERKGYACLGRNVRVGHDELDLVMRDGAVTVFVEVKLRKPGVSGSAAVDRGKRRRISRAAVVYMMNTGGLDRPARFDVVELAFDGAQMNIHHIEDAFPLEGGRFFV